MATARINGTAYRLETKPKAARKPARKLPILRRAALVVGGIGVFALGLSVIHCTQSITLFTGSHWVLSALLAVAIDAGMVACEVAELLAHDTKAYRHVKPWSTGYIVLSVILSMFLNAVGSALHAAPHMKLGSYLLGAVIPVLVFILGRVSGYLWTAR